MNEENFWGDENFLKEVIEFEQLVLSSCTQNANQIQTQNHHHPPSSSNSPPPQQHHQLLFPAPPPTDSLRYSPPRELSQRTADFGTALTERPVNGVFAQCPAPSTPTRRARASDRAKDLEIDRLKKELGRVSKQLIELEHECLELKKERNKEDKPVDSRNEAQVAQFQSLKTVRLECEIPVAAHQGAPQDFHNANALDDNIAKSSCKAVAVQADLHTCLDLSKKLQGIWAPPSDNFGRNMMSKLFVDCPSDFNALFGFMSVDSSCKRVSRLAVEGSSDASKVSTLYSAVTKISNGMMPLETLFEPLFDLCRVENDVIAHRSLHILHVLLKHLLTFERKSEGRENVMVEGLDSRSNIKQFMDGDEASNATSIPASIRFSEEETICTKGQRNNESSMPFSCINWLSLFELMSTIAMKSCEESVRLEAVSIMNLILMRSDAYTQREKFGQILVFETISQLLKKEIGLHVQKETVQLLYLLLNCPKLLVTFCSEFSGGESVSAANDNYQSNSSFKVFSMILEGLADCIACCGNGLLDLELQRNAIILLAFIASSGKYGFNILVNHQLSREATFLMLILQLIVSEIDIEATVYTKSDETFRARTLLMREVLILLNRLVSNSLYSATFLRALTINRDMASLTIDLATRLSKREHNQGWSDSMFKQMRESEIVDLGRVFKKRVFAYLGDNVR
ncbi:hypothetical protein SLE2022_224590 [Rubroshorea leprosula]